MKSVGLEIVTKKRRNAEPGDGDAAVFRESKSRWLSLGSYAVALRRQALAVRRPAISPMD
ncbi:hypothetical protein RBH26_02940 [Natronolimnohabitans sp. A-GB9]|uniref:hypothetical protein n=1 Tax=Natronolimnohabitans sp. A-GB9 TaxID=3069757 RepID=UPI0027B7628F|nr:hypothetical protein [Natronolimnohabitans sp. A-GB9]MDQ2049432.1 hypothetical protein [Natronolimnohabitans sp. A-GB9]